jgi:hypothetical protein
MGRPIEVFYDRVLPAVRHDAAKEPAGARRDDR